MKERLLRQRDLLANLRTEAPPCISFRSESELSASLRALLEEHHPGEGLRVFAYGSLMWDPELRHLHAGPGTVFGWHRSFCLRMLFGRGSPHQPGLMLALEPGGACRGQLLDLPAAAAREELELLWRREMSTHAYRARWVDVHGTAGGRVRALAFVVNPRNERYAPGLSPQEAAHLIRTGTGSLGSSRDYFDATLRRLRELGALDTKMARLERVVREVELGEGLGTGPGEPAAAGPIVGKHETTR